MNDLIELLMVSTTSIQLYFKYLNSGSVYFDYFLTIYTSASTKLKGGILVPRLPSVCLSVCPSVCGQNRVRSVTSTILARSILYLHIFLSNFQRCVACKFVLQNSTVWSFVKFVTLTYSQNLDVLVVLVCRLSSIWLNILRGILLQSCDNHVCIITKS